jgi:hypothetical protein
MMRPLQRLSVALTQAVSSAFHLGGDAEEALFRKLRPRLEKLRALDRRLSFWGRVAFLVSAVVAALASFAPGAAMWQLRVASAAAWAVAVAAALTAQEGAKLRLLIDAVEELVSRGESMSRGEALGAVIDVLDPKWPKLVTTLSEAYDSTTAVKARLAVAGISTANIYLNQAVAGLWWEVLREARGRRQTEALMRSIFEDPGTRAYHDRIRAIIGDDRGPKDRLGSLPT